MSSNSTFIIKNALLASRLSKRAGNRLSYHGISLTEFLIMDYLSKAKPAAVPRIELAEHIGMSASGITRLIAPMEKNRVVEKISNPRDARQSLVQLSEVGERLFEEASNSFEFIADDLLKKTEADQIKERLMSLINSSNGFLRMCL